MNFKKIATSTFIITSLLIGNSSIAFANTNFISKNTTTADIILTKSDNTKKMFKERPDFFITTPASDEDIEFENVIIESFKEKFINKKSEFDPAEYSELMNSFFIDALKTNRPNLADLILYESGAVIDVNYKNKRDPKITPLMAIATGNHYDGGDIEYFIKLIEMGADYSVLSDEYKIPLMSLAAGVDNYKIVTYLALLGENLMQIDDLDYYPLDYAIRNNSSKTVIILTDLISQYKNVIEKKITN